MIIYHQGKFQFFASLFRVHGSPLYRAIIPSLLSSGILVLLEFVSRDPSAELGERWFTHPYPITCMMVAFTFLLTFKCSFSYNRYWEACTAVHQMQSKWLDVGMELAAFHLQSEKFQHIRPPAFGQHPHIDHVVRKRERLKPMTPMKLQEMLRQDEANDDDDSTNDAPSESNLRVPSKSFESEGSLSPKQRTRPLLFRRRKHKNKDKKKRQSVNSSSFMDNEYRQYGSANSFGTLRSINTTSRYDESNSLAAGVFNSPSTTRLGPMNQKRPGLSKLKSVPDLSGGMDKKQSPNLFLQEASHLLSLLSAVSFATLRNDIETAESPLKSYTPGAPWPPVDPDSHDAGDYDFYSYSRAVISLRYLFGLVRTPAQRTVYNACRPFSVLGGVSDAEIEVLRRARGPLAKTALCTMWLQEFISREFLNGALGAVSPPIVSRLFQYTSDGMIGYNQARKVAYVPFPFPHSQLTTFFLIVVTCFMPILMLTFVPQVYVATILNTMAVSVFFGLWLVANELEDPFRNIPNDIPLNTFQAQFNEALIVMFAGYHPDAWWDIDEERKMLEGPGENVVSQNGGILNLQAFLPNTKKPSMLENVDEAAEINGVDLKGTSSESGSL